MKAITLWQPWASLIAVLLKISETRSWPVPASMIGRRIAIHAAVRLPRLQECPSSVSWDWVQGLPLGVVVAYADVVGCSQVVRVDESFAWCRGNPPLEEWWAHPLDGFGDYRPGRWIWSLANVVPVEPPIAVKGRQGFWDFVLPNDATD